jgi:(1->4)-alpha-D-glucan 1-alpha-D-glucosylmutase
VRIPVATYRLQLGRHLTFDDAAQLVPYLAALGVSDVYTSPFFETASRNSHGYDVCDHERLRAELGGEAAFARFADALARHGLGLLVDVVPNHMGIAQGCNAWWRDVLEHGQASPYARVFDIDWRPVKPDLADKVLLPILGDQYGAVLESGQLRLEVVAGGFEIRYYDTTLPVAPRSYGRILSHRVEALQDALGADHADLLELKTLTTWFVTLPERIEMDAGRLAARRRDLATGRERLAGLLERSVPVRKFVEDNVRLFNGTPGDPHSFDLLDALLADQAYRVAYWRVAGEEINYRRFFDVNELAAIRMEDAAVFEATHRLILRLVRDRVVTGLRIDHPDGLYAPAEYFRRLQEAAGGPLYVVAEKILAPGESLPANWAVAGTTGYEFLNLLNGLFVDRTQARALDRMYRRLTGAATSFPEIVYQAKRLIMETSMASEIGVLAHRLNVVSERHRSTRDFTLGSITRALREIIACFPVYRTYVGDDVDRGAAPSPPTPRDLEFLDRAIGQAKRRAAATDVSVYDWIADLLALRLPAWAGPAARVELVDWVMRFQQITGPVTAKGYEDTALYRYLRLVSLNEVGGEPARFGTPLAELHGALAARQREHPGGLSATSTHDTKRGEDVRARINVLSEIPQQWRRRLTRWQRLNRRHRTVVDGQPTPGPDEDYLIYQTLIGAWPLDAGRLGDYLAKAMHEAKTRTSWIQPNARYDEALTAYARAILDPRRSREFLRDLAEFHAMVAHFGRLNGLAQTVIKITAPGVPDFYQGAELWDLALVDPDNRRPVDFARRQRWLDELIAEEGSGDLRVLARRLWAQADDGRVKLFVIRRALAARTAHAELFREGDYQPLEVHGTLAEHVVAFARVRGRRTALTVVPRLLARRDLLDPPLGVSYWGDTRLVVPSALGRAFVDGLTGCRIETEDDALPVGRALSDLPVALLVAEDPPIGEGATR